jgi:hypothetical protein
MLGSALLLSNTSTATGHPWAVTQQAEDDLEFAALAVPGT